MGSSARKIYRTEYSPRKEESSQIKTLSCYPKKQEKNQINNLTLYLKQLEKEEMKKPRVSRRKEIIKIRAEINKREKKGSCVKNQQN